MFFRFFSAHGHPDITVKHSSSNALKTHSRKKFGWILFAAILLTCMIIRLGFLYNSDVAIFHDTAVYDGTYMGWRIECSNAFWTGICLPVVSVVFKIFNNNYYSIAVFQFFLSSFCWAILAFSLSKSMQTQVMRFVSFSVVLLFSLTANILYWDKAMLSESLALSLQALLIAIGFWLVRTWGWHKFAILIFVAFLWCFVRDTNVWYLFLVGLVLLLLAIGKLNRVRLLLISGVFLFLFLLGNYLATRSLRWTGNFFNVLTKRVLVNENHVRFFEDRGMPVSPTLLRLAGRLHTKEMHSSENFAPLRDWVFSEGKKHYICFLLSHPEFLLISPLQDMRRLLGQQNLAKAYFRKWHFKPPLPQALSELLYPERFALLWVYFAPFLIGLALFWAVRDEIYTMFLPIGLVVLSYPHAMITWHGDALEIVRHSLLSAVQFRLGMLLCVAILVDRIAWRSLSIQSGKRGCTA